MSDPYASLLRSVTTVTAVSHGNRTKKTPKYGRSDASVLANERAVLLNERDEQDYSDEVKRAVDVVTLNEDTLPVGSYRFNAFKYPGDIDIFETVTECCTRDEAARNVAQSLNNVAEQIRIMQTDGDLYWVEMKAGINPALIISGLGQYEMQNIECVNFIVYNYDAEKAKTQVRHLMRHGVIPKGKGEELLKLILPKDKMTSTQYSKIVQAQKSLMAIRWTLDEVLHGAKTIDIVDAKGRKKRVDITLEDALKMPAVTKLDTLFWSGSRYVELTNIFYIEYDGCEDVITLKEGSTESGAADLAVEHGLQCRSRPGTLSAPLGNHYLHIAQNLSDYLDIGNYAKSLKRWWVLLRLTLSEKDKEVQRHALTLMQALAPAFTSKMAVFSRLAADTEALSGILSVDAPVDHGKVDLHLATMEKLLFEHANTAEKSEWVKLVRKFRGEKNTSKKMRILDDMLDFFKKLTNEYAYLYLKEHDLLEPLSTWCEGNAIYFR